MAPALTKILKDGHCIHLSSPLGSIVPDSAELDSPLRSADALHKMWLNASSLFPSVELGLAASPLDFPSDPSLSSCLQASSSQREALFLPSPASLLSLVSSNTGLRDSHQVASVFPGVPDMFLAPVLEHNSQEAPLLSSAPQCGPGGGDVLHSPPLTLSIVPPPPPPLPPPSCSHGEIKCQGYASAFPPPLTVSQVGFSEEPGGELLPSSFLLEEATELQLSRQAGLHSRAKTLRRRLQALLGEHAVRHCNQQLEGLSRQLGCAPADGCDPQFSWLSSSTASASSLAELLEFSQCSQALLQGLQQALDSEATASSSSSDEELEDPRTHRKTKAAPLSSSSSRGGSSSSCERRWLEERAELGSRWSWLQLRLAELEGRIQQQVELHKHMRSMKRCVVLAESQPLTDRQIQQTLLREMAGLSCTASDADTEPCSPTRLLHNIERQSAQLSQIVNSLMTPLSFSPLSKQPHTWKGHRASKSGHNAFVPEKRRRLNTRRLFKADVSCVCARTRPLVTYHKPRLFTLSTRSPSTSLQDSETSPCGLPSSPSSCSCPCCSSCDPAGLCSSADSSSRGAQSSRTHSSTSHPAPSLSHDAPPSLRLRRNREEWSQRPLVLSVRPASPAACDRRSSTPLHDGHRYKQHSRHPRSGVLGLSPIGTASSAQGRHRRSSQRKRKRRHLHRLVGDDEEEEDLYQLCDTEDSSEEVLVESYTHVTHKQSSQGFVRKRQGESVYNINNIVIPMLVTKVEKLQYKDILTPSWRTVGSLSTDREREEDSEEGQEEDLADEVFAQRHLALEQREKLRWGCWGQKTGLRHPKRSGSRSSGSGGGMCTSGEESSVELSCAQLETDEQQSSEEWLPQTPWEPRAFPLDQDDEAALLSDGLEEVPSGSQSTSASKNYSSHLCSAQSSQATLPPAGHSRSRTPDHS